jgi:multidrug transporter EmrE-like cation transporter
MGFLYILGCILCTVYGQMVVKLQVSKAGPLPAGSAAKVYFLLSLLLNPWVMSGVAAGFLAMLCWMAAMTKFELSYAYPFMSLAFVLVTVLSVIIFKEAISLQKVLGLLLIVGGIVVSSRG